MTELELKFQIPEGAREGLLKAVGERHLEHVQMAASYADTADHLLARHRFALRLRCENGRWVQTLKANLVHSLERLEHEVELAAGALPTRADPALHLGTPVGDALRQLLEAHGHPALQEIYRTEFLRLRRLLAYREALVEWSLDEGRITAGAREAPLHELELEIKAGDAQALYAMGHDWLVRHRLWLDAISKAHRGSLLAAGRAHAEAARAESPRVNRGMGSGALLRAIVAACLAQVLPNASEVAAGSTETEHVHQLRVGLRRLRTALRELAAFAPEIGPLVEEAVAPAFAALGAARDQTLRATTLAAALAQAGAPLTVVEEAPVTGLAQALRASQFQDVLLRLLAYAQGAQAGADELSPAQAKALVCERLGRLHQKLEEAAANFHELDLPARHQTRKRLKRLRYLAGFVAPLFRQKQVRGWLDRAEPAQDALGAYTDLILAAEHFEAATAHDPRAWFAVGWLRAREAQSADEGQRALQKLLRAPVFW